MWMTAKSFDGLLSRVRAADALTADMRQRYAVQQQNFDWLATHVNRLEVERAMLIQRLLSVGLAVPTITREDAPPTARPGMGEPLRAEDRPTNEEPGMALAAMQAGSFEDMGDAAAERFGVVHDNATGTVRYTR